ncbi:MAG: phosphatidylglycerophosphatase A [Candidatus Omnitrophica bacterium]|nr:phosphatidylglycerophosphatase A [Candidatus Omnitrophota bacterium]
MQKLIKLISTCFYTGYSPVVPGTLGSLAGLLLYVLIGKDFMFYTGVSIFLLIVGFLISGRAENIFGIKDDRRIVIDEVCGMMLSLLFIPYKRLYYLMGFLPQRLRRFLRSLVRHKTWRTPCPFAQKMPLKGKHVS